METQDIIEEIRKFVEEECKKPGSKYGYDIYAFHLVSMHKYAKAFAVKLGADSEIVELAAWLHDIGSIINGRKDHHVTGAEISEKKLRELGYPQSKIEKVKHCILSHRGSQNITGETVEAQIVADADAISNINNIPGIFKAAYIFENQTQGEAKETTKQKLKNKWNQLSPEGKELIKEKYEAAMLLLS